MECYFLNDNTAFIYQENANLYIATYPETEMWKTVTLTEEEFNQRVDEEGFEDVEEYKKILLEQRRQEENKANIMIAGATGSDNNADNEIIDNIVDITKEKEENNSNDAILKEMAKLNRRFEELKNENLELKEQIKKRDTLTIEEANRIFNEKQNLIIDLNQFQETNDTLKNAQIKHNKHFNDPMRNPFAVVLIERNFNNYNGEEIDRRILIKSQNPFYVKKFFEFTIKETEIKIASLKKEIKEKTLFS